MRQQEAHPAGQITTHPDGRLTVTASGDACITCVPTEVWLPSPGRQDRNFSRNGRVNTIHTPSMDVVRNVRGQRTVSVHRPDRSLVVSTGLHLDYVERTVVAHGAHTLIQRTYLVNNVHYSRHLQYLRLSRNDACTITSQHFTMLPHSTDGLTTLGTRRFATSGAGLGALVWFIRCVFCSLASLSKPCLFGSPTT